MYRHKRLPQNLCTVPRPALLVGRSQDRFISWPNSVMKWCSAQPTLNIYTGFTPSQLMTKTSGCCYSL